MDNLTEYVLTVQMRVLAENEADAKETAGAACYTNSYSTYKVYGVRVLTAKKVKAA